MELIRVHFSSLAFNCNHAQDVNMKADINFSSTLRGHELNFCSTWGLFSPKEIDEGTRLLVEEIEVKPGDSILDLGCGYGPLGIALGLETSGAVHMVDKDFVAVEYAEENARLNGLKNTKVYLSNGLSHVPTDVKFDLIVSNLPAKPGKELYEKMLDDCLTRLKPGGRVYFVTIAGLREYIKRTFKEKFGNYKKLKEAKGYTCALAIR